MTDAAIDARKTADADSEDIIHEMSATALSDMLDALSDVVCVCIDGKIRHANATAISVLGAKTQDDLLGVTFQSLVCDDFVSGLGDLLAVLAEETEPTPLHVTGSDGRISSLGVKVRHLPELGSTAYAVTAQNITLQVALSQAVRESESRFSKLVDSALDLICVMQGGVITYVNQAGLTLLKADFKDEVVGKNIDQFIHPDYQGIIDDDIHEFIDGDALIPMRFVDISLNRIDVEVGISVLEDGTDPRYMIEARDITAHNRAVTALRQSIENLEQRVVERTSELQEEVMERRRAEEMLRHVASHDGLTDLPNRSLLMDRVDRAITHAHRDTKKCAVLFIDLDGFKPINDTLGHDKGDVVLREVATRLTASVRETDTAARFGGDEFVLVLTDLEKTSDAEHVAKKVLTQLALPIDLGDGRAQIGASIGIAFYPDDGENTADVMKQADNAMYDVKAAGKNNYAMASDTKDQAPEGADKLAANK